MFLYTSQSLKKPASIDIFGCRRICEQTFTKPKLLHRLTLALVLRSSGCVGDDADSLEIQMASFSLMHTPHRCTCASAVQAAQPRQMNFNDRPAAAWSMTSRINAKRGRMLLSVPVVFPPNLGWITCRREGRKDTKLGGSPLPPETVSASTLKQTIRS